MTYSATSLPAGLSLNASTGILSGTISTSADANSPYTVIITASDGAYSASQTITWAVNPYPVTLTSPGNQTNYDSDSVDLEITASDTSGGTMAFSTTGLPAGLSIDPNTGTISGTISNNADTSSPYTTVITVGDGTYSASQTITWTVSPYPTILTSPGNQTNLDDDLVNLAINASDATGDTLIFDHAVGLPPGLGTGYEYRHHLRHDQQRSLHEQPLPPRIPHRQRRRWLPSATVTVTWTVSPNLVSLTNPGGADQ